jgi:hypothetical protein
MNDQAQALREFVKTLDPKDFGPDFPGRFTVPPLVPETFEDYQQRLAWYRTSQELKVRTEVKP